MRSVKQCSYQHWLFFWPSIDDIRKIVLHFKLTVLTLVTVTLEHVLGEQYCQLLVSPPPFCWGHHLRLMSLRSLGLPDAPRWVALPFLPFQRILVSRKWGSPDAIACPIAPPLLTKTDTKADTWTERESWVTWPASGSGETQQPGAHPPCQVDHLESTFWLFPRMDKGKCLKPVNWC